MGYPVRWLSGPVSGSHRIRSVRSGADSPEPFPVSGPVRCHIPKSVLKVYGQVLVFTDPVAGPSSRRFSIPPDPVHYTV
jgi:hypothetical protein